MIYNMLVNRKFLFCNNFFKTIATPSLLRCKYREKNWKGKKFFAGNGKKCIFANKSMNTRYSNGAV